MGSFGVSLLQLLLMLVMPECYKPKKREVSVSFRIFSIIACIIYLVIFMLSYENNTKVWIYAALILDNIYTVKTYYDLFMASKKLHSKLLNEVIAIFGVLSVICLTWFYLAEGFYSGKFLVPLLLFAIILFLQLISIPILLDNMKYNGDYTAPDEIEEYEPLKYCWQCGNPVGADENFCTNCGAKVE
jgi:hypothetical protein